MAHIFTDTHRKLTKLYQWGYGLDFVHMDGEDVYVIYNPVLMMSYLSDCAGAIDDLEGTVYSAIDPGHFFMSTVRRLEKAANIQYDMEEPDNNVDFLQNYGVIGSMTQFDVVNHTYRFAIKDMEEV